MVVRRREYDGTLFDEGVYERREFSDGEAAYEFVFRFTPDFFDRGMIMDPR